jgi:hypothetical protein
VRRGTPLSVGSKSLSGSGMSKVATQIFRLSVEISENHIAPFAVYRQCNNPGGGWLKKKHEPLRRRMKPRN